MLRLVGIAVVVAMLPIGGSFGTYLTAPGDAPVSVRTVDWLRDHGFNSAIDDIEQWWYTRHRPTGSTPPRADIPAALRHSVTGTDRAVTAALAPAPGEAVWVPVTGLASRPGSVAQTFLHPDAAAPSVVADVVRFDQSRLRTVYVPGLAEPGGTWSWRSEIPPKERPTVVAAFNAGFKFHGTAGGVYTEGRHAVRPLAVGIASLVVHTDGRADVVAWPGDSALSGDVAKRPSEPVPHRRRGPSRRRTPVRPRSQVGDEEVAVPVHLALGRRRGRSRTADLRGG